MSFVAAQIIEDNDVAGFQRRCEDLVHIGMEDNPVHRTVDDERRGDPIVTQASDKGRRLPVSMGQPANQAHAPLAPAAGSRHVGFGPGLIDEDQMFWIKRPLTAPPSSTRYHHVRSVLLRGEHGFF